MREVQISECERSFVLQALKNNQRLDGRKNDEFREVVINFGSESGSVFVGLGTTQVLAQVTTELGPPKANRPNEGTLYINVDLGKMAASHLESARYSDLGLQLNRILERTFKDSNCVDVESLCITAEECVWTLRVDVNVLNHEGNLVDCCSIAVLSALANFKRPDVKIVKNEIIIQSLMEKEPIPIVMHHYPVCVSYCTVADGELAIADPSAIEERIADSVMVFGLNSFQELCCMNLGGTTLTSVPLLLTCLKNAGNRVKSVVELVKESLRRDQQVRASKRTTGFTENLHMNPMFSMSETRLTLKLRNFHFKNVTRNSLNKKETDKECAAISQNVITIGEHTAIMNSSPENIKWIPNDKDLENNSFDSDIEEDTEDLNSSN